MSRIGKAPIPIPSGVSVEQSGANVKVKGPKGELEMTTRPEVEVAIEGKEVLVKNVGSSRQSRAFHGLTRALINNMVEGVAKGYEKILEIHGVGYNATVQGRKVVLNVGFCNSIDIDLPDGIDINTPNPTTVIITGADKQAVGQVAARMRAARPPEPYNGKGVRYRGEHVRQKAGKSFGT